MCGIYGMLLLNGAAPESKHRGILTRLAIASQARGRDATGLSFAKENGITYFKHNIPANSFVNFDAAVKIIEDGFNTSSGEKLYSVIGHTRQKTQGTEKIQGNNHPIRCGSLIGVHNGCISNDNAIFAWLEHVADNKTSRIAQVDSEAIFALINHYARCFKDEFYSAALNDKELYKSPVTRAIMKAVPRLRGSMACALQDGDNPKVVWLFKTNNPTIVYHYKEENIVIFASTDAAIKEAVAQTDFSTPETITMAANQGITFNLEKNIYNKFDLEAMNHINYY